MTSTNFINGGRGMRERCRVAKSELFYSQLLVSQSVLSERIADVREGGGNDFELLLEDVV